MASRQRPCRSITKRNIIHSNSRSLIHGKTIFRASVEPAQARFTRGVYFGRGLVTNYQYNNSSIRFIPNHHPGWCPDHHSRQSIHRKSLKQAKYTSCHTRLCHLNSSSWSSRLSLPEILWYCNIGASMPLARLTSSLWSRGHSRRVASMGQALNLASDTPISRT